MKLAAPSFKVTKPLPFSQRQYLVLAIPLIISGISTPLSAQWGLLSAVVLSLLLLLLGDMIVELFITITAVKEIALSHLIWMFIYPIVGFWSLQLEGIFSGAAEARSIRDSIALALIVFLLAIWLFVPTYGNHGVWLAFTLFSLARSFFLSLFIPKLTRTAFR
jgi:multidrug resistance protein, MATE family